MKPMRTIYNLFLVFLASVVGYMVVSRMIEETRDFR